MQEVPICPNCAFANKSDWHFCHNCAAPLTQHATTDPVGQIYSAGFAYRHASQQPTKLIVLIGMWLIWAPVLPAAIWMLIIALSSAEDFLSFVLFLGCSVFWLYVAGKLLYRTTKNYFTQPSANAGSNT